MNPTQKEKRRAAWEQGAPVSRTTQSNGNCQRTSSAVRFVSDAMLRGHEQTVADDPMLTGHGDTILSYFLDNADAPSEFIDLSANDFLAPTQQTVFGAIVGAYHAGVPVNVLSVTDRLRAKGQLKNVGGESWHAELPKFVSPAMAQYAIDQLRDASAERKAKETGRKLEKGELDAAIAANQLLELASQGDSTSNLLDEMDKRRFDAETPPPAAPPLFKLLDFSICTAANLTGIQAQAKGGKTAIVGALIAATFAEPEADCLGITSENPDGFAVIHFDTEQSPSDHLLRFLVFILAPG